MVLLIYLVALFGVTTCQKVDQAQLQALAKQCKEATGLTAEQAKAKGLNLTPKQISETCPKLLQKINAKKARAEKIQNLLKTCDANQATLSETAKAKCEQLRQKAS